MVLQRLIQFERILRRHGWRAALKAAGRHCGKRLGFTTVAEVDAIRVGLDSLRAEFNAQGSKLLAQDSKLVAQDSKLDARQSDLDAQRFELQALRSKLEGPLLELAAQRVELQWLRSELEIQRAAFETDRSSLEADRSKLETQRALLETQGSELHALRSDCETQRSELESVRSKLEVQRVGFETQRSEVERLAGGIVQLGDEHRLLQGQLDGSRQRIEVLYGWKYQSATAIRWLADHHSSPRLPARANLLEQPSNATSRVSVIMPAWNRAATIGRAIRSVLDQTYPHWELLIVDDGSHDDTRAIVGQYQADHRIRFLEQAHAGACAARNLGLLHARGEIIAYLDSDNVWYPDYLTSVVAALDAAPDERSCYAALLIVNATEDEAQILAWPYDRGQLEEGNRIDLNVFAHRRELYDRLGGFDESLARMQDWDLILRYTEESPPRALPVLGTRYYAGRPDSISTRESQYHSQATILRKRQLPVARLKVLYALWHYPQLSESYVETEIRYMQHRGVDVEVWSEVAATTSPYPTTVPIHHGTLAEAIEQVRPDVVHVHWLIQALKYADIVRAAGLSLTVRGHGFEVTSDTITSLEQHPGVSAIYLFPQFAGENLQLRPKIRPMTACFNPKLYAPAAGKDPRLVVRVACALASKDLQSFIHLAQRFPDHHFVLAIVKAQGLERYVDEVVALNESLGSPVDIRVNVSFPQVAALVRRAGIYLHTHGVVAPFGMPISIAEAMATGCYLIARRCPPAEAYVGPAGRCYDTLDEAEALVRETVTWNDDRWRQARRAAVDHAYRHYVDSAVLPPLVEQWMQMAGKDGCETREHSLRHSTPPSSIRICA